MRRQLACLIVGILVAPAFAAANRTALFLDLVTQRNSPTDKQSWGRNVATDAIWIGRGLRVARRTEVEALQMGTGKSVEIQDFEAHDYGDTAVLTYVVVEHHPQDGGERIVRLRKLDTYLLRDQRWQLVSNAEMVGRPDRKSVAIDPAVLDRCVGEYELRADGKPIHSKVWREGSKLYAQTEGQEKGELLPLSATVFFDAAEPQDDGPENEFVTGADGRATEWIYRAAGVEFRSRRVR